MGVDLRLLPLDYDSPDSPAFSYSHTVLSCDRNRDLWTVIGRFKTTPLPENFTSFLGKKEEDGDYCYGQTHMTPYGSEIATVTVKQLLKCADHEGVKAYPTNRAIWAYLACLPKKTRIALFWH